MVFGGLPADTAQDGEKPVRQRKFPLVIPRLMRPYLPRRVALQSSGLPFLLLLHGFCQFLLPLDFGLTKRHRGHETSTLALTGPHRIATTNRDTVLRRLTTPNTRPRPIR